MAKRGLPVNACLLKKPRMKRGHRTGKPKGGFPRFYGRHAVIAALANPDRVVRKIWGTREAINALEQHWFAPLYAELGKGKFTQLRIESSTAYGTLHWTSRRADLWKLWRRPQPLRRFRVAVRRHVVKAREMREQRRGHAPSLARSAPCRHGGLGGKAAAAPA